MPNSFFTFDFQQNAFENKDNDIKIVIRNQLWGFNSNQLPEKL